MMRILSIMALLIAALSFDTRATRAAEGPWCANINIGTGNVYEDCQYYSFEVCQPVILAGNRGFCNVNPRWVGPRQTAACGKDERSDTDLRPLPWLHWAFASGYRIGLGGRHRSAIYPTDAGVAQG